MKKFILSLMLLAFCFSIATAQEAKKDEKVVNIPPDMQQAFQASQSDVEKAEANLRAAQAALEMIKAKQEALVLRIMLLLKLPADARPQLEKGLLQFTLPPEEKPAAEKKPN